MPTLTKAQMRQSMRREGKRAQRAAEVHESGLLAGQSREQAARYADMAMLTWEEYLEVWERW